jgi:hypothetical protein
MAQSAKTIGSDLKQYRVVEIVAACIPLLTDYFSQRA